MSNYDKGYNDGRESAQNAANRARQEAWEYEKFLEQKKSDDKFLQELALIDKSSFSPEQLKRLKEIQGRRGAGGEYPMFMKVIIGIFIIIGLYYIGKECGFI